MYTDIYISTDEAPSSSMPVRRRVLQLVVCGPAAGAVAPCDMQTSRPSQRLSARPDKCCTSVIPTRMSFGKPHDAIFNKSISNYTNLVALLKKPLGQKARHCEHALVFTL